MKKKKKKKNYLRSAAIVVLSLAVENEEKRDFLEKKQQWSFLQEEMRRWWCESYHDQKPIQCMHKKVGREKGGEVGVENSLKAICRELSDALWTRKELISQWSTKIFSLSICVLTITMRLITTY